MIIENLTCTCGKTCRIETDDPAFVTKKKKEFEKTHRRCANGNDKKR